MRARSSRSRTWDPALAGLIVFVAAQSGPSPTNDAPNPYRTVENWAQLPEGRKWGSLSAVEIDKDGKSIWVAERCGGNSACLDSPTVDPILKFDSSGKLLKSFGAGMLVSPHGIYVDRDGNIWVTDYQDNAPRPARGAAPAAGQPAPPAAARYRPTAARSTAGGVESPAGAPPRARAAGSRRTPGTARAAESSTERTRPP